MATAGALAAASLLTLPGAAHAGFLDFLFGGVQQPAPPVNSYTEPPPPIVVQAGTGRDARGGRRGRRRPLRRLLRAALRRASFPSSNGQRGANCRAMPSEQTKVLRQRHRSRRGATASATPTSTACLSATTWSPIAPATAATHSVAPLEATSDPTLRAGDIVATKDGLQAYTGRRGQGAAFSPVDEAAVTAELTRSSSRGQLTRRAAPQPVAEEEPVAVGRPDADPQADSPGQATR